MFNSYGHFGKANIVADPSIGRQTVYESKHPAIWQPARPSAQMEFGTEGEAVVENGELDPQTFVDNGDGTQGPGGVDHEHTPPAGMWAALGLDGSPETANRKWMVFGLAALIGVGFAFARKK